MDIPKNVLNPALYKKARKEADEKYKKHGLYKNAFLVKRYKELGGKYSDKKNPEGITRWLKKEEWVEVIPYLKTGKKIVCGSSQRKNKSCRPLVRANDKTPITIPELLKIHGKDKLLKIAQTKVNNPEKRLYWKTGKLV